MRSCSDGYPSCRHAEATGKWCGNECHADIQKELDALLVKREKIREKQMARFHNGSATRARTTTGNADADRVNDRIISIRERLRSNAKLSGKPD
jgi:hypothetical protein